MGSNILIIDDEEQLRSLLRRIISLEGFMVHEAGSLQAGLKFLEKNQVDVILCDVKLPDGSGVDFVKEIKQKFPLVEIILLTAYATVHDGIQAMKNGAFDYLMKGDDNNKVVPLIYKAVEKVQLQKRIQQLEQQIGIKFGFENILGESPAIKETIALAKRVASTDTTVLLSGETGTGKEVFAQAIHTASTRFGKSFMALNCSAFSKELLESEIFGHKSGAFTGATKDKRGLIEEANGGTLFLDEIGEMHIDLQSKMLRVLETSEFIKVGDTKSTKINVRFIAATNRDLKEAIKQGKFREDLFYRLNVFSIHLPPLRERKEDILPLANNFLKIFSDRTNKRITDMSKEFMHLLQKQEWKGNIRELKNSIERAVILADGPELKSEHLPLDSQQYSSDSSSSFDLASLEKSQIQKVLRFTKGNKTKAAELLGIGLTTLYRKLEEYEIPTEE
ncbi:MAG TPA: sigma-54 dependent transcriptional regulator [Chitinophagaceae bacterium]|nr:sigma-54 dependent transcriptional regulator [Chitinophagaceae bacterium]